MVPNNPIKQVDVLFYRAIRTKVLSLDERAGNRNTRMLQESCGVTATARQ